MHKRHAKPKKLNPFHLLDSNGPEQRGQPMFEGPAKQAHPRPQLMASTDKAPEVSGPEVEGEVEQATRHRKLTRIVLFAENRAIFSATAQTKSKNLIFSEKPTNETNSLSKLNKALNLFKSAMWYKK